MPGRQWDCLCLRPKTSVPFKWPMAVISWDPRPGVYIYLGRWKMGFVKIWWGVPVSQEHCHTRNCVLQPQNEERRQAELKKRHQYNMVRKSSTQYINSSTQQAAQIKKSDDTSSTSGKSKLSSKASCKAVRCYNCNKIGRYASECRAPKTESCGDKPKVSTKQVTTSASTSSQAQKEDPRALLHSDSDSEHVQMVTITEQESKTHRAQVMVQGVPAKDVIDTGAEITIVGGELFQKVASTNHLMKRDFKPPDKTPRTYNQQVFSQDGCIELDLTRNHNEDNGLHQDGRHWAVTVRWGYLPTTGNCYIPSWCRTMPGKSRDLWCSSASAHCQSPTPKVRVHSPSRVCIAVKTTSCLCGQDTMMLDSDPPTE